MKNPVFVIPEAMQAMLALRKCAEAPNVPKNILTMVHLRASQINGCSFCTEMHSYELKNAGEPDERIFGVAAWRRGGEARGARREAHYFNDAERTALALTETVTRLADRSDPMPNEIWNETAKHYDEKGLAALAIHIALINAWNRINATARQLAAKRSG